MTRMWAVGTAFVVLTVVDVVGWTVYLHEPLPLSVWVRRRSSWADERREVIYHEPSGTPFGDDWYACRHCNFDFTPLRVVHDCGETNAGVNWLRSLLGLTSSRFIEYLPVDRTVEQDDGTWLEYALAND